MELIDVFKTFHLKAKEYTFFSSAHETLSRTTSWVRNQTSVNSKKVESVSSIFFDHNSMRLYINYRGKKLLKTQTHGD